MKVGETPAIWGIHHWNLEHRERTYQRFTPDQVHEKRGGNEVVGYPALIERNGSVSLRLLESPEAAREASRLGLRRLFAMAIRREFKIRARDIPQFSRLATLFAPLGSAETLLDQILMLVAEALCLRGVDPMSIRDARAFEARPSARPNIVSAASRSLTPRRCRC